MSDTDRATYSDDQNTGYFDSAARADTATGSQSQTTGGGSSAAERLGGPSESDKQAATGERTDGGDAKPADGDTASGTGAATGSGAGSGTGSGTASGAAGGASGTGSDVPARLIDRDRAESYQARWKEIKGDFVDEPKAAVRGANELVGEVLDQLEELFRNQRSEIEKGLDSDETTTEDLRLALGKYRSFFDRLLSI